ncbi:AraC family transcriptional regulator [Chitinophaga sp. HK235]|uniref:helix-turn-helix transcriptional regulator n=1 Tax=Chitinophaga sp. HK235 TaxID=2952571 RepID=UPI001BAC951E|nr:AraC family transcriptional regulator [Chitinophaga sp. HK235]
MSKHYWKVGNLHHLAEQQAAPASVSAGFALPSTRLLPRITDTPERYERIQYERLEPGCMLVNVYIKAKTDTIYHLEPSTSLDYFYLAYTLYQGEVVRKHLGVYTEHYISGQNVCSFYNNLYGYESQLSAGTVVRTRFFAFTAAWLQEKLDPSELAADSPLLQILEKQTEKIAFNTGPFQVRLLEELDALMDASLRSPLFQLELKKHSYTLISNSFKTLLTPSALPAKYPAHHEQGINLIVAYLDEHFQEGFPGLPTLAGIGNMSVTTMRRQFQQHTGYSPFDYFHRRQMNFAVEQLQRRMPVKEVALSLGIRNPANFTRLFRKYYGITPADIRKKMTIEDN